MDGIDLSIIKSDGNNEFISVLDKFWEFEDDLEKILSTCRRKLFYQRI